MTQSQFKIMKNFFPMPKKLFLGVVGWVWSKLVWVVFYEQPMN